MDTRGEKFENEHDKRDELTWTPLGRHNGYAPDALREDLRRISN